MGNTAEPRKALKTYSRANKRPKLANDDEDGIKRRKTEVASIIALPAKQPFSTMKAWLKTTDTLPTTPSSDQTIFSDDSSVRDASTPPSSPPPSVPDDESCESERRIPNTKLSMDPLEPRALHDASQSAQNILPSPWSIKSKQNEMQSRMIQMQINLGSALQKTCRECGMTYVRSSHEDCVLHDHFHARNLNGVDLGKPFRRLAESRCVWRGSDGTLIVVIDANDKAFEKRKARDVLDVVQMELGAVDISDPDLWAMPETAGTDAPQTSRYRAFLYLKGQKCVGLCLAKRITSAYAILGSPGDGSDPTLHEGACAAKLGISRIWTSKIHRGRGIARELLDSAAGFFDSHSPVPKNLIAFSQPTTSGAKLARTWFGKEDGWLVYLD